MSSKPRSGSGKARNSTADGGAAPSPVRGVVLASAPWVLGALLVTGLVSWSALRSPSTAPSSVVTGASQVGQCVVLARQSAAAAVAATSPVAESPAVIERRNTWKRLAAAVEALKADVARRSDQWFPKTESTALLDGTDLILKRSEPLLGGGATPETNDAILAIPGLSDAVDERLQSIAGGVAQVAEARSLVRLLQFELFGAGTKRAGTAENRRKELARLSAALTSLRATTATNEGAWFPQAEVDELLTQAADLATEGAKLEDEDDPAALRDRMDAARQASETLSRQSAEAATSPTLAGRCQALAEICASSATELTAAIGPAPELNERRRALGQLAESVETQLRDVSAHSASWFPRAEAEALLNDAAALLKQANRDVGGAAPLTADSAAVRNLTLQADAVEGESQRMSTVAAGLSARPFGLSPLDWTLVLFLAALLSALAFRLAAPPGKAAAPFDMALRETRDVCEVDGHAGIRLCHERSKELLDVAEEFVRAELLDSARGYGSPTRKAAPRRSAEAETATTVEATENDHSQL